MTRAALFPTPGEVEANTPATRDRAIDVIRILSLLAVVVGHTIMATSTLRDDVFIWSNLLTASVIFQVLTWVFQIMPLFFFAGVAACVESWQPGTSWGNWLMRRCTRLYRPVFYYLAFWVAALSILRYFLPEHVYDPVAGIGWQLLWFLGAYVLVLAAVPLLARITTTGRLAAAVAGTYALIAVVDAARINVDGLSWLGYLNLVVWLIPGMFGVAYRRKLLAGQGALTLGVAMLVVNVALMWLGPYELSLVGIETQQLKNMTPPSLLLAGHAIMMCAFVIAAAPAIARWARRPRVWWLVAIGNTGAMTLYLWHIPALLFMHLVFDYLGHPRYDPSAPGFVAMSSVQVLVMGVLVAALFIMLRPLENNSLPLWDGGLVAATGWRSIAVGGLLCVAGAATLASVGWGLKGPGLYCVAVMLATLGRRPPAGHRPGPPKGSAGRRSHHDQRRQQELQCHASAALAAEFPSVLDRSVRSRLLVAAVLVSGAAGRLRLLTLQGFPEPLLVVVFRCISHSRSLARCTGGGRGLFPSTNSQRFPGGTPYRCEIGNVITTRRSSTIALR